MMKVIYTIGWVMALLFWLAYAPAFLAVFLLGMLWKATRP